MSRVTDPKLLPIWIIMLAVLVWGTIHALGAFLYNYDVRKPLIVLGCVLGFVLFWAFIVLARERTRLHRRDESRAGEQQESED